MLARKFVFVLAVVAAYAADDPWAKVRELKTGAEIRVFKKGVTQPVTAKMDELTGDNLVVVVKNEQVAIPREQIDRIDYRPAGGRATKETKTTTDKFEVSPPAPGPYQGKVGPSSSTSTSVSLGRPDFETIYRRPAAGKK